MAGGELWQYLAAADLCAECQDEKINQDADAAAQARLRREQAAEAERAREAAAAETRRAREAAAAEEARVRREHEDREHVKRVVVHEAQSDWPSYQRRIGKLDARIDRVEERETLGVLGGCFSTWIIFITLVVAASMIGTKGIHGSKGDYGPSRCPGRRFRYRRVGVHQNRTAGTASRTDQRTRRTPALPRERLRRCWMRTLLLDRRV